MLSKADQEILNEVPKATAKFEVAKLTLHDLQRAQADNEARIARLETVSREALTGAEIDQLLTDNMVSQPAADLANATAVASELDRRIERQTEAVEAAGIALRSATARAAAVELRQLKAQLLTELRPALATAVKISEVANFGKAGPGLFQWGGDREISGTLVLELVALAQRQK